MRRSRSPDRTRREIRRDVSRGSRAAPPDYKHDRRSPRRRSYSPASPRRRSPKPIRRRTPSPPSRSRSRSPTRTPPAKRHVLPPLKSPSRPPPPPPPTGPRVRSVPHPVSKTDPDGDVAMEDPSKAVPEVKTEQTSPGPEETPAVSPPSAAVPASPRRQSVAPSPISPAAKSASTLATLPSKPELEVDRKPLYPRRRSRSPPSGPRHHQMSTPPNKSPAHTSHAGPNLPSKPDWIRRNMGREPVKQEPTASTSASTVSTAQSEPAGFVPVIPPYQPKPSITADIEAEVCVVPHDEPADVYSFM